MRSTAEKKLNEVGYIDRWFRGIAFVHGLPHVAVGEVLVADDDQPCAIVIGFGDRWVEALFFDERFPMGKPVQRGHRLFSVPVADTHAGRVLDGLGRSRDALPFVPGEETPVFRPAPAIIDRNAVTRPLVTGIKMIDAILPLGRGQRELIIGDRRVGKGTIGLDTILHQRHATPAVQCVYVSVGNKSRHVADTVGLLNAAGAMLYTTVVAATSDDSFAAQYLAPFVGCVIAEHFRDEGRDALIVYDDFSKHAKAYRDISLLLERPPGRETYPADIFSLHAGLLERAGQLSPEKGGGSLTALPIIETQEGDMTSYIPTNIISITDGQIYLERALKERGFVPAVDAGLSVSRLGSQVQPKPLKEVTAGLRLELAQHRELQKLAQLETTVSDAARERIQRGNLILEVLKQGKHDTLRWEEQVVLFYAVENGFLDDLPQTTWRPFERNLLEFLRTRYASVLEHIRGNAFDDEARKSVATALAAFKEEFVAS
ncbi:MAG: F0F1 ATP synthase subunit alpha [Patescibacteria group bacterium]|nr:F0F1 ATP synthase subunit alpha [Patescibacteria group bacterium]